MVLTMASLRSSGTVSLADILCVCADGREEDELGDHWVFTIYMAFV